LVLAVLLQQGQQQQLSMPERLLVSLLELTLALSLVLLQQWRRWLP
jgi:hypothetical protein